jgi:hypothetical protein
MRKSNDHYAKCYWCGNPIYSGEGERARVFLEEKEIKHFHENCVDDYHNAIKIMRQMEED